MLTTPAACSPMATEPARVYLGHALTDAPREFIDHVGRIREWLQTKYKVLQFKGLVGGTPPDVYRHDARCVSECDVFIMAPGAASTGLGIEAQIAANTEKLAILLLRTGERVSRMLLGCPNPNQIVVEYDTVEEALQKIDALIEKRVDRTRQGVFVFEDEVRVA